MDFQEAFLILFWPVWSPMLGLFIASTIVVAVYWLTAQFTYFRLPSQTTHRFAGVGDNEED